MRPDRTHLHRARVARGHTIQASREIGTCQRRAGERERGQLGAGRLAARQPGERATEPGGELEAVGGAERRPRSAGCPGRRSTTKSRSDVSVYRHVVVRGAPKRSPTSPRMNSPSRCSIVGSGSNVRVSGSTSLPPQSSARLDGRRVAVHGEPVEAGIVHPDPHREAADARTARGRRAGSTTPARAAPPAGSSWPSGASRRLVHASAVTTTLPHRTVPTSVTTSTSPPTGRIAVHARVRRAGRRRARVASRCKMAVPRPAGTMPVSAE